MALKAVGTKLYDGDVLVTLPNGKEGLSGPNDTTAHGIEMALISGSLPEGYRYGNHNLPQYPVPGSTNSDADCKIPASSYKEFKWKYCWLVRNALGGAIQNAKDGTLKGTTQLNHLRVGWPDVYFRDIAYKTYKTHRAEFEQSIKDWLDMAVANGVYLNITLMGGGSELNGAFGAGYVFTPGSEAFANAVQFEADVINMCGNHKAIGMFCLNNEPVNYNGDGHDLAGRSAWWDYYYGRVKRTTGEFAGYEEWEARYLEWKNAFVKAVRAKIVASPQPLLEIGGGNFTIFWATWNGHTLADIDWEKKRTLDYAANVDIIVGHGYSQAEYNDAMKWASQTMQFVNKPSYAEEYGFAEQAEPWRYSYWPWYDLKCQQFGFSQCTMVLAGMADPQPLGSWPPQMAYPGYPVPQAQMDAAEAAWKAYVAAPSPPPPTPEPTPTTIKITIKVPVTEQGMLTIPGGNDLIPVPDVVVPSMMIAVPARALIIPQQKISVPKGSIFGGSSNVTIPQQSVIIPAWTINIPPQTVKRPALTIEIAEVKVQLPKIDIAPFDVEVTK